MRDSSGWPEIDPNNCPGSYYELIGNGTGIKILDSEDDRDYQGDSFALVFDAESARYGWLTFGWGSCSWCDAFQSACDDVMFSGDVTEMTKLRKSLVDRIEWRGSIADVVAYASDAEAVRHWSDSGSAQTLIGRIRSRHSAVEDGGQ